MAPLAIPGGQEKPSLLRGVTEKALLVHHRVRVLEGTFPRTGEGDGRAPHAPPIWSPR